MMEVIFERYETDLNYWNLLVVCRVGFVMLEILEFTVQK